ncbi:MAG: hypothetical protein ACOY3P_12630, partial [Planctomycetota bacterium]
MCENCNRREFMGVTAGSGLLLAAAQVKAQTEPATPPAGLPAKVQIAVIFAGKNSPPDRAWGVCQEEQAAMTERLKEIEDKLGNVEFVIGSANNAAEASKLLKQAGADAPVLVVNQSIRGLLNVSPPILEQGRPLAVFSTPASGHDWMYPFRWREEGKPVTMFATSDYGELERAARLLRVFPLLKKSRVLVFEPFRGTSPACSIDAVREKLGVEVVVVGQDRFDALLAAVDEAKANADADEWLKGAKQTIEPTREDVLKAARVSLALEKLVAEEKAQALAVGTCMGWLARGFPCLGFTRLRDRGIPASCEGDMDSLWTMLLFNTIFGIPGFQGNSTFDTAKNQVWTAHCVGP